MEENPYKPSESNLVNVKPEKKGGILSVLKKVLISFGVFFAIVVLLLIWAGISTSKTYGKFEHKAEPFIKGFLEAQSPWNYEKSKSNLSEAWLEITSDEAGQKLFRYFNKLGSLKSIGSIEWQGCNSSKTTNSRSVERCNYLVQTAYENGDASILFGLSLESEEIKLMQLKVNSDAFIE